jgi:hypothetical protein
LQEGAVESEEEDEDSDDDDEVPDLEDAQAEGGMYDFESVSLKVMCRCRF